MYTLPSLRVCLFLVPLFPVWTFVGATNTILDDQTVLNPSISRNCTRSHLAADDIASGDVSISAYNPLSNNEFPKMTHLNTSAWELWFFDAVSSTDDAAITLSFFRDGSGTRMGKGSLRTQVHVAWPDGETFGTEVDVRSR